MNVGCGAMYPDWSVPVPEVDAPATVPFPEDPDELDTFIDRIADLAGESRRQIGGTNGRHTVAKRAEARDRKPRSEPRIELVLYTSPESEKSHRAVRAVQAVLKRYNESQVRFTMCDLSQRPQDGDADSEVFTPTLVKQGPGPKTAS